MAWTTYTGLTVPSSTSGDAGGYLSSDLEALADRVGPCNFTATSNPGSGNDATQGYEVGSFWVNTSTNTWFVCVNNTPGLAVWQTYLSSITAGTGIDISGSTISIAPQSGHAEVVVTDTSGNLTTTSTTTTEIGYVHGVTSAIQTQLDARQAALTAGTGIAISGATISNSLETATQSANKVFAGPTSGSAAAPTFRAAVPADLPVMVASGGSHAAGIAPDPGATSGTTRFLREDATWDAPPAPALEYSDGHPLIDANNHLLDDPANVPTITDYTGGGATITGTDQCCQIIFDSPDVSGGNNFLGILTFSEPFPHGAVASVKIAAGDRYSNFLTDQGNPIVPGVSSDSAPAGIELFITIPVADTFSLSKLVLDVTVRGY